MRKQYKVVATFEEFEARLYPGSCGYQIWKAGEFYSFWPTLPEGWTSGQPLGRLA